MRQWRGRTVGDRDEAGARLARPVRGETYQWYVRHRNMAAPGHVTVNPETGAREYDLDQVDEWDRNRSGAGARTDLVGPTSNRQRAPRNQSRVSPPKWTGGQGDMIAVSRGEPRRTDEQMIDAVEQMIREYLTAYPPRTPIATPVAADIVADICALVAADAVTPQTTGVAVSREHLIMYVGLAHGHRSATDS